MKIYSKICLVLLTLAITVSAAFAQEGKTPPKTKTPIVKVEPKEKNDREQQERQKQEEQRRQQKERNEPQ